MGNAGVRGVSVMTKVVVMFSLWAAVIGSALSVVYGVHESRNNFGHLESLKKEYQVLQAKMSQYILEESAWASFDRIENVAEEQLLMQPPSSSQTVMVLLREQ